VRSFLHELPIRLVDNEGNLLLRSEFGEVVQQLVRVDGAGRVVRRDENDSLDLAGVGGDEGRGGGDGGEERRSGTGEREDGNAELGEGHFVVEVPRSGYDDGISRTGEGEDGGIESASWSRNKSEKGGMTKGKKLRKRTGCTRQ
jgi:hypothetical protein